MKKYIIGIPLRITYLDNKKQYYLYTRYEEYLRRHGFTVVYLTPFSYVESMRRLDAILLPGGGDINPKRYGGKMSQKSLAINDELDAFEFALLDLAIHKKKAIFGICRGLQLLNVYCGGTLKMVRQHFTYHEVNVRAGQPYSLTTFTVNSFHHQAIDHLASNFLALFTSPDGVIEGIVDEKKMILAVQYHPEINDDYEIIDYFKTFLNQRAI